MKTEHHSRMIEFGHMARAQIDVATDIIDGTGASHESAHYALRRVAEIFARHGEPADGLRLSQVQLAAILAGAHDDGAEGVT